mmetsp:Transcript_28909/g.94129  ORF Transcript_28909/g.94129 Transcript_28909/m.94129 type:complete len:221 (-) Transcript_28909:113-775(-)
MQQLVHVPPVRHVAHALPALRQVAPEALATHLFPQLALQREGREHEQRVCAHEGDPVLAPKGGLGGHPGRPLACAGARFERAHQPLRLGGAQHLRDDLLHFVRIQPLGQVDVVHEENELDQAVLLQRAQIPHCDQKLAELQRVVAAFVCSAKHAPRECAAFVRLHLHQAKQLPDIDLSSAIVICSDKQTENAARLRLLDAQPLEDRLDVQPLVAPAIWRA